MNQSKTKHISTPCYILEEEALLRNLEILDLVQKQTGCKIIMALKGFAMFAVFPLIKQYLYGVTASSVDEARLGYEEFGKEVHVCSPAYSYDEFYEILNYADHIVFNSFSQWKRFKKAIAASKKKIMCGIRINPEHSEVKVSIYDPCGQFSRLGTTRNNFDENELDGITGLHFHNLCELNSDSLLRTLKVAEEKFGMFFNRLKWINFGGGHHITRKDYDINLLCNLINDFKKRYPIEVYLEPGEAIALNAGVLEASVIDIIHNEMDIAILDASAATHMPDVLEMPYRPNIRGAGLSGEYKHLYRLGGATCLAGDIVGDYSFPKPLEVGSRIVFEDMAHYTMVKNNTFNGIRLPSIAIRKESGDIKIVRKFGYEDYKYRLS
ncbi:MAG: carboxynorspermidine decarboxylase [Proteobacteria bacterium]|nr:carboxynorspermidine decarboxylase [Pseudomonadota bacterium]